MTCRTKTSVPPLGRGRKPAGMVDKELMNGRVAGEMMEPRKEAKRAPRAANPIGTATRTREAMGAKGKARAKSRAGVKPDTATCVESKGMSG